MEFTIKIQQRLKKINKKTKIFVFGVIVPVLLFFLNFISVNAFVSPSYRVDDPVMFSGGFSTSPNFQLNSVLSQMAIGTSTALNFGGSAGFLYFPFLRTPALSATPSNNAVNLSWTSAISALGWNISGYSVGVGTNSLGPYTYTNVGNVLSHSATGLTNGVTYFFVVRVIDALGNNIATSTVVAAVPVAQPAPPPPPPGGGGGGAQPPPQQVGAGAVVFSGRAYPMSRVSVLKDGQLAVTTIAGPDSNFSVTLGNLSAGNYNFSLFGEDKDGIRSAPFSFPIFITEGVTTNIGGIFIVPTISVDKNEVRRGDNIIIFGQAPPEADVVININSSPEFFIQRRSDEDGIYLLNFDTSVLDLGRHSARSKASKGEDISGFSNSVGFVVGTRNVLNQPRPATFLRGDLNNDGRVNLVDFSIAAYWYRRSLSESFGRIEIQRLNGDGKIDLVDFSIMAFYWTG